MAIQGILNSVKMARKDETTCGKMGQIERHPKGLSMLDGVLKNSSGLYSITSG